MGLIASVYVNKHGTDCSLNGISNRFIEVCIVNLPGPFSPSADCPAVEIVKSKIADQEYLHAEPVADRAEGRWVMAGGAFIFTSDSRFCAVSSYPIALHDRCEG